MKITGVLVSTAALLGLGWMPRLAEAQECGVAYADFSVNTAQLRIEAWTYMQEIHFPGCPWAEAYQYGYFEHHYSTTVTIESPTGRSAYGEGYQVMPYGGGGASAFTFISYYGDAGEYDVDWFMGVFCTIGGTLGLSWDSDEVEPPSVPEPYTCTTIASLNALVISVMYNYGTWPRPEAFERGFSVKCAGSAPTPDYYSDSFADFYLGQPATNDPCVTTLRGTEYDASIFAGAHSHPYFSSVSEMNRGDGCLNYDDYESDLERVDTNEANEGMSDGDEVWINMTGLPLFMRPSEGSRMAFQSPAMSDEIYIDLP